MKIDYTPKLDFDDVLLVPQRSKAASRKEVNLSRNFQFYHSNRKWSGVPIIASNMDTVGTIKMADSLSHHNAITCLHKHHDIDNIINYLNQTKNYDYAWISIGMNENEIKRIKQITEITNNTPNICIDIANGYTENFVEWCSKVRNEFKESIIMAGNVCTPEMVSELILHGGVDIVKVGIGPGSACTTRLKTGVGYPQLSCIDECAHAAHGLRSDKSRLGLICADGGCKNPADVSKALASGADFVMIGGMLAGTDECDGEWEYEYQVMTKKGSFWQSLNPMTLDTPKRKKNLKFYGMSSHEAQTKYGGVKDYSSSEGRVLTIPYKGPVDIIMKDLLGGIRSACAYTGATCLKDFSRTARFILVNRVHYNSNI